MKAFRKTVSLVCAAIMLISSLSITSLAASYQTNYSSYTAGTVYYTSPVMKNTSAVKYYQRAINYCILYLGLNTELLDCDSKYGPACKAACAAWQAWANKEYGFNLVIDGSFGPASQKAMKAILNGTAKKVNSAPKLPAGVTAKEVGGKFAVTVTPDSKYLDKNKCRETASEIVRAFAAANKQIYDIPQEYYRGSLSTLQERIAAEIYGHVLFGRLSSDAIFGISLIQLVQQFVPTNTSNISIGSKLINTTRASIENSLVGFLQEKKGHVTDGIQLGGDSQARVVLYYLAW